MLGVVFELMEEGLIDYATERGIVGLVVGEVEREVRVGEVVLAVGPFHVLHQISEIVLFEEIVLVYFL